MSSDFTGSGVAAYMSDRMDWETPAASSSNHKCAKYYTAEDSAFDHEWGGETVFCNPPYGKAIAEWVRKCSMEASRKDTTVVMLLPSRTDTRWWHRYILNRAEVRFLPGRLRFETDGKPGGPAPFPSAIVVMRTGER